MNRRWVAAGLLAASMSLSGGPSGISDPIPGGMRGASVPHEVVMLRLHQLNPQLSPAQRLRIWKAVERFSAKYDLERELVLAVIEVESRFNRFAISSAGAQGLMQVMPFWKDEIGRGSDRLTDVYTNLRYGCHILHYYLKRERGNLVPALARYNGSYGQTWYAERVLQAWQNRWLVGSL